LRRVLDVLADFLGKISTDARGLFLVCAEDDRRIDGLGELLAFLDVMLFEHPLQYVIAADERAIGMCNGTVAHRGAHQSGDHRRFGKAQFLRMLAEIEPRRRFDAVRAMPEVNLIRVELENLVLCEALLDVDGQKCFVDLAAEAFLRSQENLLGQLLCERRRSLDLPACNEVFQAGAQNRFRIDAAMLVEIGILGGQGGLHEQGGDVPHRDHDPPLDRILREGDAVAVVDAGDDRGLVVLQPLDHRDTDGAGEEESCRDAEDDRHEEDQQPRLAAAHRSRGGDLVVGHVTILSRPVGIESGRMSSAPIAQPKPDWSRLVSDSLKQNGVWHTWYKLAEARIAYPDDLALRGYSEIVRNAIVRDLLQHPKGMQAVPKLSPEFLTNFDRFNLNAQEGYLVSLIDGPPRSAEAGPAQSLRSIHDALHLRETGARTSHHGASMTNQRYVIAEKLNIPIAIVGEAGEVRWRNASFDETFGDDGGVLAEGSGARRGRRARLAARLLPRCRRTSLDRRRDRGTVVSHRPHRPIPPISRKRASRFRSRM